MKSFYSSSPCTRYTIEEEECASHDLQDVFLHPRHGRTISVQHILNLLNLPNFLANVSTDGVHLCLSEMHITRSMRSVLEIHHHHHVVYRCPSCRRWYGTFWIPLGKEAHTVVVKCVISRSQLTKKLLNTILYHGFAIVHN